jgi:hypothetical protein
MAAFLPGKRPFPLRKNAHISRPPRNGSMDDSVDEVRKGIGVYSCLNCCKGTVQAGSFFGVPGIEATCTETCSW